MQVLARQMQSDSAFMLVTDLDNAANNHFLFNANIDAEYRQQYESKLNRVDSFNRLLSKHPYRIFYSHALGEMVQQASNGEFALPQAMAHGFGVSIPCNHKHALSLRVHRQLPFSASEQKTSVELLKPVAGIGGGHSFRTAP